MEWNDTAWGFVSPFWVGSGVPALLFGTDACVSGNGRGRGCRVSGWFDEAVICAVCRWGYGNCDERWLWRLNCWRRIGTDRNARVEVA